MTALAIPKEPLLENFGIQHWYVSYFIFPVSLALSLIDGN